MKNSLIQVRSWFVSKNKPMTATEVYMQTVILWVSVGLLTTLGIASAGSRDWELVVIGFICAGILAWAAHTEARKLGYIDALHHSYMEWYTKHQETKDD